MISVLLNAFVFRSWKPNDSLLDALDLLRGLYAARPRQLPQRPPTAFLKSTWRKLVGRDSAFNRRAYEVAVMMTLCDSLRSGDIWVEGSRAFRAFGDFLLPPEAFATRRQEGELGLAVPDRFNDWRTERTVLLELRLDKIDLLASAGKLVEAAITAEGLSISPIRKGENDEFDDGARRIYGMLPRLRITELLAEVNGWTGFAERFVHLRTGAPPDENIALMTALLADATNLGLARMARSSKIFSHSKLLWITEWHVREETYQAALACLIEAIHAQPFTRIWGDGGTSSSDGQFFKAGGHGEAGADYNAKYGSEPASSFIRMSPIDMRRFTPRSLRPTPVRPRIFWTACFTTNALWTFASTIQIRRAPSITCSVSVISRDLDSRRAFAILPTAASMSLMLARHIILLTR